MDSSLLREREAFKRKAMTAISVSADMKKNRKDAAKSAEEAKRAAASSAKASQLGAQSHISRAQSDLRQIKHSAGGEVKFAVLSKIVRFMRQRHMEGLEHPLTLEDILDESRQLDVSNKMKVWLETEALKSNEKIKANPDGTYIFRPPFAIMNKKGLMKLLKQHDLKGLGGIFLEDVQESLPKSEKIIRQLTEEDKIIIITRPVDKKKVMFLHDHNSDFDVDEEFTKLWRSVAVDSLDDVKVEEYLEKHGIKSMQDHGVRTQQKIIKSRKPARARKARAPKDNDHLAHVLEDYSELTAEKAKK